MRNDPLRFPCISGAAQCTCVFLCAGYPRSAIDFHSIAPKSAPKQLDLMEVYSKAQVTHTKTAGTLSCSCDAGNLQWISVKEALMNTSFFKTITYQNVNTIYILYIYLVKYIENK